MPEKRLITHSGPFHTDDVYATALLLYFFPDAEVIRTRDDRVINTGDVIYDVGRIYDASRARFDHHQQDASTRDNGIIYSSFGLLWKEYGVAYCDGDKEVADLVEQKLVAPIDANDNGQSISNSTYENVRPFTIDDITKIYNPLAWLDPLEDHDTQFHECVQLAKNLLKRVRDYAKDNIMSQKILLNAYVAAGDKRIVLLDKPVNVNDILDQCPELLYVISPRPEQTWSILAVSTRAGEFTPRRPFPESWRAKDASELSKLSGIDDAIFCHTSGFLAVARSREGAASLAEAALKDSV